MSNDIMLTISNSYILHCGIIGRDVLTESMEEPNRTLTSMWTMELCIRYCDICKILGFESLRFIRYRRLREIDFDPIPHFFDMTNEHY